MLRSRTLAMSQKLLLELLLHAVSSSRKRRNKETQKRVAKRKLIGQPEISHASAEQLLKSREPRTDEQFVGSIHAGHQLALLQEHSKVFFCSQCGVVNAGGSLRLLKSQCDGTGESRRKARRKLERGLMLNAQELGDARRSFLRLRWREFFQRRLLPLFGRVTRPISCRDPCWEESSGGGCTVLSFEGGRPWSCVEVSFPSNSGARCNRVN